MTMLGQNLWANVFQYWPATCAMVVGSFIAGSTPLGGGVVAFPVTVLVLGFTSEESRDASVLVQSIGMNAAAYLLLTTKRDLLDAKFIAINSVFGTIGIIIGLAAAPPSVIINTIYTVLVFEFGLSALRPHSPSLEIPPTPHPPALCSPPPPPVCTEE